MITHKQIKAELRKPGMRKAVETYKAGEPDHSVMDLMWWRGEVYRLPGVCTPMRLAILIPGCRGIDDGPEPGMMFIRLGWWRWLIPWCFMSDLKLWVIMRKEAPVDTTYRNKWVLW